MESKTITSDDILGKDVVDIDGEIIGVVQQIRIDKESKKIVGILIDQGFMKPDLYIGLDFVKNFGVDSIFLSRSPRPKIKGLDVYDRNGKKIGFVHDVLEKQNVVLGIVMKKSKISRKYLIRRKNIKVIGFNIVLRVPEKGLEMLELGDKADPRDLL